MLMIPYFMYVYGNYNFIIIDVCVELLLFNFKYILKFLIQGCKIVI